MVMGDLPIETDLLVLGGGPGGYAAAFRAADHGLDVTLVDQDPNLGGACLLRGCIPSKALLHLAELILDGREADAMGLGFPAPELDLARMRAWTTGVIEQLSDGLERLREQRGVRLVRARGSFQGAHRLGLEGADYSSLEFRRAVIATGSRPRRLPGLEVRPGGRVMDSAGALALPDIPRSLLVVGGGYVGLELGTVYATLGSRVTLVEMDERLLGGTDADLVQPLESRLQELFEAIHLNTRVERAEQDDEGVEVDFDEAPGERFERVLVAVGRRPNTDELGLEQLGVSLDHGGFIPVDAQRRTDLEHVYAVGDVCGGLQLAHEAMHAGKVAADVLAGKAAAFDVRAVPAVIYTLPQIAWCGLTETQAQAQQRPVRITRFPWRASGRALSMGAADGLTKLVLARDSGRVLGMGVVGRDAESLIAEGVHAIEMGTLAEDLAQSIHPHPSLSETVGEAAELFFGGATHLKRKR